MRVLVCGGRDFGRLPLTKPPYKLLNGSYCSVDKDHPDYLARKAEFDFVISTLSDWFLDYNDEYYAPYSDLTIIHGGATGADHAADEWAIVNWVNFEEYKADWKKHGRSAGSIRNREMLYKGNPDVVVAFPGGPGTADMVRISKEAGVPVIEVKYVTA